MSHPEKFVVNSSNAITTTHTNNLNALLESFFESEVSNYLEVHNTLLHAFLEHAFKSDYQSEDIKRVVNFTSFQSHFIAQLKEHWQACNLSTNQNQQ